jgi:hypothetical protein
MSASASLRLSPAECTCFRIRSAARRVTAIYSQHLAPTGLKISQFSLLGFIAAEGPVSIGRLAELLATDRTTLTRNLKPLLDERLAERAASGDRRRHELVATAAGPCSSAPCRCGPTPSRRCARRWGSSSRPTCTARSIARWRSSPLSDYRLASKKPYSSSIARR